MHYKFFITPSRRKLFHIATFADMRETFCVKLNAKKIDSANILQRHAFHLGHMPVATRITASERRKTTANGPSKRSARVAPEPLFHQRLTTPDATMLADDILPAGTLLECVSADVLNGYINYVELRGVITERDPEEHERYISVSNRFYTHFHEFGTVIHVIASSARYWWYFCYDIDASDCAIGRLPLNSATLEQLLAWVAKDRIKGVYPVLPIDTKNLRGFRSFQ